MSYIKKWTENLHRMSEEKLLLKSVLNCDSREEIWWKRWTEDEIGLCACLLKAEQHAHKL
jgi:hypothetical protein